MGLTLTTVVDESTQVNAASVNQYKTAIEQLAGAGWNDSAGDLDVEELSDEVKTARGGLASLDTRLDVSLENAGTLKSNVVSNVQVAADAAITGSKIVAATTSARGTVELATDGENAASVAVQGNDSRLLTSVQKTDLTDGGATTLHTHTGLAPGDHGHTGPGDGGTLGNGVVSNTQVASGAAITGSKVVAATTSARGTVELTTEGERTAGLALQANDGGILSPTNHSLLTTGSATVLHHHVNVWGIIYVDHVVATSGAESEADAMPVHTKTNDGVTGEYVKIRTAYRPYPYVAEAWIEFQARVSVDPDPAVATVKARVYVPDTAYQDSDQVNITDYGTYGNYELYLDMRAFPDGSLVVIELSAIWTTMSATSEVLQIRHVVIQHIPN